MKISNQNPSSAKCKWHYDLRKHKVGRGLDRIGDNIPKWVIIKLIIIYYVDRFTLNFNLKPFIFKS